MNGENGRISLPKAPSIVDVGRGSYDSIRHRRRFGSDLGRFGFRRRALGKDQKGARPEYQSISNGAAVRFDGADDFLASMRGKLELRT